MNKRLKLGELAEQVKVSSFLKAEVCEW